MNYQEKCRWLSDFYKQAAETGREMQHFVVDAGVWVAARSGPCEHSDPDRWRIKPPDPPKAWVVWGETGISMASNIKFDAEKYAQRINGTIQEITRPD